MRHRHAGRKLNRNASHRKALFKNLANSLIEKELIKTTVPKAKELRSYLEPLITLSKKDSVANRRLAFSRLRSASAVGKLFSELGERYSNRPGGYLRVLKAGFRVGDSAPMAYVELIDRPIEQFVEPSKESISEDSVSPEALEDNSESTTSETEKSKSAKGKTSKKQEKKASVNESDKDTSKTEKKVSASTKKVEKSDSDSKDKEATAKKASKSKATDTTTSKDSDKKQAKSTAKKDVKPKD